MKFEWNRLKSAINEDKHGVSFKKAVELFLADYVVLELDSRDEPCWAAIGVIDKKIFTAIFTRRGNKMRLISVRRAHKDEEKIYGQNIK